MAADLVEVDLVEHFFTTDLVETEILEGHGLTGMVEKLHYQANVVVSLDIDSIGTSFAHSVGAQVVDAEQVAGLVHDLVELLFGDVARMVTG